MPGALRGGSKGEGAAGGDEPTIGADQPAHEQADGRGLARRRRGVARQWRRDSGRGLALPRDAVLRGPDEGLGCHPRVRPPAERDEMLPGSGQHRRRPDIVEVLRIRRGRPRPAIRRCPEERPVISVLARRPAGGDIPGAELDHRACRVTAHVRLGSRPGQPVRRVPGRRAKSTRPHLRANGHEAPGSGGDVLERSRLVSGGTGERRGRECLPRPAVHRRPGGGAARPPPTVPTATSRPGPAATAAIVPAGCVTFAGSHVRPSGDVHTPATSPASALDPAVPTAISRCSGGDHVADPVWRLADVPADRTRRSGRRPVRWLPPGSVPRPTPGSAHRSAPTVAVGSPVIVAGAAPPHAARRHRHQRACDQHDQQARARVSPAFTSTERARMAVLLILSARRRAADRTSRPRPPSATVTVGPGTGTGKRLQSSRKTPRSGLCCTGHRRPSPHGTAVCTSSSRLPPPRFQVRRLCPETPRGA